MIPWVREKFAERRAKWVASRNSNKRTDKDTPHQHSTSEAGCSSQVQSQSNSPKKHSKLKSSTTSSDAGIRPREKIRARIICPNGRLLSLSVDPGKRLLDLKQEVVLELYEESGEFTFEVSEVSQFAAKYRLLKSDSEAGEVNEQMSLQQIGCEDQEMFVLQKRRFNTQEILVPKPIKPPTASEIAVATMNVPHRNKPTVPVDINEIFQQSDLQFDVRKVIISLAQQSAYVIAAGPYASKLLSILKQKLANKRSYEDDTLQCLIDMGFSEEKSKYALKINNGMYGKTLEWLIQHQNDEIPSDEDMHRSSNSASTLPLDNSIVANVEALLEIVRIYSHREIPPSEETIHCLVEMGFEEKEVLKALKKTCNNKAAACEYLCGNRTNSLIELRDGLAKDSPILQAILSLPKVQMSLSCPKVFLAFLAILENENSVRVYGGDEDTSSVITHILQKYHEEKHALGINQFYNR